ncbi:hydroxymethylglutaryl-CoA reductase [Candidatus Gottesmanbacteria bacterium]|nr:hydroxymethylglutaryl-CoA reductase [Candidatus Gottesmanbacteria bacterium]
MKSLRDFKTVKDRRDYIEKLTNVHLKNIGSFTLDEKMASSKNCENMIGIAQVPMGIAGPLRVKRRASSVKEYYIPLATTEGALVASVNRGCKAISEVNTYAYRVGTTRGPVFYVGTLDNQKKLYDWIKNNQSVIKKAAESTSQHIKYKKSEVTGTASYVFIRFYFDTQDAMGMNMVTIATQNIVSVIEEETGFKCLSVAGNFDIDKKPAWLNMIAKRGIKAWAEAAVDKNTVKAVLKTTSDDIYKVWLGKCMIGSALAGSMGFNAHFANVVAGIFAATGQDIAHVVEGSMGITTTEVTKEGDLYISVYLPDLMLGTVGGGTALGTQKEALELLGVYGGNDGNNAMKFAEIVAGSVLAGELSLLASFSQGSLAAAHRKLGRGEKI